MCICWHDALTPATTKDFFWVVEGGGGGGRGSPNRGVNTMWLRGETTVMSNFVGSMSRASRAPPQPVPRITSRCLQGGGAGGAGCGGMRWPRGPVAACTRCARQVLGPPLLACPPRGRPTPAEKPQSKRLLLLLLLLLPPPPPPCQSTPLPPLTALSSRGSARRLRASAPCAHWCAACLGGEERGYRQAFQFASLGGSMRAPAACLRLV